MDLTPEHDWSDEAADAATLELMAAWPGSIGGDEVWAEQIGRIAAKAIWPLAYRAGQEDAAAETDEVRRAARHLCARIIASAHLLDVPFTNAPDQSPWTKLKRDMAALYAALGIQIGNQPRTPEADVTP